MTVRHTAFHTPRKAARIMMTAAIIPAFIGVCVLLGASDPARAQGSSNDVSQADQYKACLKLARLKPEDGFESAMQWRDMGGGEPARHCVAIALIGLGKYGEAGTRLDKLAKDSTSKAAIVAGFLAQAGQAWVMDNNLQFAWRDQTRALRLVKDDPSLWIDRGVTLGMAGQYWESIDDLNKALDLDPDNVDALVYRGSAWRMLKTYDLARTDIDRALQLNPNHQQALLESGNLYRIDGKKEKARKEWVKVIEEADGTPAARAAKDNIEKMDVRVEPDATEQTGKKGGK
jgi:tetratricopeptide (TPR) repeat protein